MYSRGGNKFDLPKEVLADMPDTFVDGELWYVLYLAHPFLPTLLKPKQKKTFQVWTRQFPGIDEDSTPSGASQNRLGVFSVYGIRHSDIERQLLGTLCTIK